MRMIDLKRANLKLNLINTVTGSMRRVAQIGRKRDLMMINKLVERQQ